METIKEIVVGGTVGGTGSRKKFFWYDKCRDEKGENKSKNITRCIVFARTYTT